MAKKLTAIQNQKMNKPFLITSLCRVDLTNPDIGFSLSDALKVTDEQMERIASKMADDYCNQLFWGSLEIISESVLEEN